MNIETYGPTLRRDKGKLKICFFFAYIGNILLVPHFELTDTEDFLILFSVGVGTASEKEKDAAINIQLPWKRFHLGLTIMKLGDEYETN